MLCASWPFWKVTFSFVVWCFLGLYLSNLIFSAAAASVFRGQAREERKRAATAVTHIGGALRLGVVPVRCLAEIKIQAVGCIVLPVRETFVLALRK